MVQTKIQSILLDLVQFLLTLPSSQETQDSTTDPHVCVWFNDWTKQTGAGQRAKIQTSTGAPAASLLVLIMIGFNIQQHMDRSNSSYGYDSR